MTKNAIQIFADALNMATTQKDPIYLEPDQFDRFLLVLMGEARPFSYVPGSSFRFCGAVFIKKKQMEK